MIEHAHRIDKRDRKRFCLLLFDQRSSGEIRRRTVPVWYGNKTDIISNLVFEFKTLLEGPIQLLNTVINRYGIERYESGGH